MALAALFGALALFWISTRQFPLLARAAIWVAGAGLLAWTAFGRATGEELGLWLAFEDVWTHQANLEDAAIVRAFRLNSGSVAPFLVQLLDFFVVAGAVLGTLALLAFTKGERLEKALRPTLIGVVAFVAGSIATLTVVAIGFGGYARPRSFFTNGQVIEVHDGDTFKVGEFSLRLYGVDAPEGDQTCRGPLPNCGSIAREYLENSLAGGVVRCDQMLSRRSRRPRDTFGRALVRCWRSDESGSNVDVAEELFRRGYAVEYEGRNYGYGNEQAAAAEARAGLWAGCTLDPDEWRNNDDARAAFIEGRGLPEAVQTIGTCERTATTTAP